ncbi:MAG: hypothetical protein PVG11_10560, partial [Anaerolineae bacterium]
MTGRFVVDWAIMAVSLFDTILLLWLGLAVILNADRRHWGIWLAGGGLLLGSAFFVSHTAILGHGLHSDGVGTDFWWRAGWVPVLVLPFIWYVVMLWYAGYWDPAGGRVRRRHRLWLLLGTLLLLGLGLLFLLANPLPTYYQVIRFDLSGRPAVRGVALLILLYPIYALGAILLSLDAVWRPAPSGRVMGDVARRRARPWLVGASVVVLLVAAVVGLAMAGVVLGVRGRLQLPATLSRITVVAVLDVTLASLIGAAVVLLGQAVVAYEVFTGKALPRRGLLRHWQRAVGLAAGFGLVVGWSMALGVNPIYGLLLAAGLMTFFYALLSWRSYAERERYIDAVRPFAASPRLYEYLVSHPADPAP